MNRPQFICQNAVLLGLLLVVAVALGCDLPLHHASETVTEVFASGAQPKIVVETFNGTIDISNGQSDEVVVEVTKRASGFDQNAAELNLDNIEVTMAQKDNEIHVLVKRIGRTLGEHGASVVIAAPAESTVQLKTSNGHIVSEGMLGDIKANTSNGKVDVVEAQGQIEVRTSNAPILIEAENALVDAGTSNSRVRFRGSLAAGDNELSTSNGRIEVALPKDSQFEIKASTSNGRVNCEFDVADDGNSKKHRRLHGTVGSDPQFTLELSTSNSSIDIREGSPIGD